MSSRSDWFWLSDCSSSGRAASRELGAGGRACPFEEPGVSHVLWWSLWHEVGVGRRLSRVSICAWPPITGRRFPVGSITIRGRISKKKPCLSQRYQVRLAPGPSHDLSGPVGLPVVSPRSVCFVQSEPRIPMVRAGSGRARPAPVALGTS